MKHQPRPLLLGVLLMMVLACGPKPLVAAPASPTDEKLAEQGYEYLKKFCYQCHGVGHEGNATYNVLRRDILVAARGDDRKKATPYVTPGSPDKSYMWHRVAVSKEMPPEDSALQPTAADNEIFKRWIEAGALFPTRPARAFKSETDVLTDIYNHLTTVALEDRPFTRYFTLTHLYNNDNVTELDLRLYRAALCKLANSVSWEPDIYVPEAIDKEQTIYVVDLRKLGWDRRQLWQEILKQYPYGLRYDRGLPAGASPQLAQDLYTMAGTPLPMIRADWFVATVSRPPLYHTMLGLPKQVAELEKKLNVNVEENFLHNKLVRAGFASSGVSKQNRLVERHAASYGAYWKSYDFKPRSDRGDLTRFPLGPEFKDNPFPNQAFVQAGGEIIFNLPNGLQGYLLVNTKGERIDEGPVDIVSDSERTAGTPAIVNGVSCMACHSQGMRDFKDTIREGDAVGGDAHQKVEQLFAKPDAMQRLLRKDSDRFNSALREATAAFLQVGEDQNKELDKFPEPVQAIVRLYLRDLDLQDVAAELDINKPETLRNLIQADRALREKGLGPLVNDGKINREHWDALPNFLSNFQEAARQLQLGTPFRVF